jgi:hypothetical protein
MPGELERRGVWKPQEVCDAVATDVKAQAGHDSAPTESDPEAIFRRLGSS